MKQSRVPSPELREKARAIARDALRCCLTRIALMFEPKAEYSGDVVQSMLLGAMMSIDGDVEESGGDHVLRDGGADDRTEVLHPGVPVPGVAERVLPEVSGGPQRPIFADSGDRGTSG
jgi:hypothetical protein